MPQSYIQHLAILYDKITQQLDSSIQLPGINHTNYFYLQKLAEHPGLTQSDFSQFVKLTQSTVTRAINKLVKLGYVQRKVAQNDGRRVELGLTQAGVDASKQINRLVDQLNRTFENLDENHALFTKLNQANQAFTTTHS
ncbi:MarR family transcriptional regulator [Lentilactobacillus parafarraginis]|jgi:DNA-binding MarR family transcriptional regulator|uniref:HTH marR-type domain-containing protein n=2 Tax=Lentilactobacillus parafarraginis TaxID=390842 RepID=A0A0R1YBK1_9LACO|nr:MarR family transcriptional regulator [Lentilactobacillus parafarraginis]KRM39729.1 hypothetical protein FD47_GL002998 [Lentilactobacillus parafarraginis DSM 18390 = JCM 14109]TLQ20844.1 MarR family transcriptional regulator [Lentilactobacillus parafarraginis]